MSKPFVDFETEFNDISTESAAFKCKVLAVLRQVEPDGHDFCGDECATCGIVDSEPCCPVCLAHNGGKLGGKYRHEEGCALHALILECGGY